MKVRLFRFYFGCCLSLFIIPRIGFADPSADAKQAAAYIPSELPFLDAKELIALSKKAQDNQNALNPLMSAIEALKAKGDQATDAEKKTLADDETTAGPYETAAAAFKGEAILIANKYGVFSQEMLAKNPFLKSISILTSSLPTQAEYDAENPAAPGATPLKAAAESASGTALLTGSGGVDAVGTFIANRFKQEAEIVGVQELIKELIRLDQDDAFNHPMTALLPQTMALVYAMDASSKKNSSVSLADPQSWNTLMAALRADLKQVDTRVGPFIDALKPPGTPPTLPRYELDLSATLIAKLITSGKVSDGPNGLAGVIDAIEAESDSEYQAVKTGTVFASQIAALVKSRTAAVNSIKAAKDAPQDLSALKAAASLAKAALAKSPSSLELQDNFAKTKTALANYRTQDQLKSALDAANASLANVIYIQTNLNTLLGEVRPDLKGADSVVKGVTILSHLIQVTPGVTARNGWASQSDIEAFLKNGASGVSYDQNAIAALLGLSYAKDGDLYGDVFNGLSLTTEADINSFIAGLKAPSFWSQFEKVSASFNKLYSDALAMKTPPANATIADIAQIITDTANLYTNATAVVEILYPDTTLAEKMTAIDAEISKANTVLTNVSSLVGNVRSADYAGVVANLIVLSQEIYPDGVPNDLEDFLTGPGQAIGAMAQAKTDSDMEAALEKYALPTGSYLQKQSDISSVTLNGYFGVTGGMEALTGGLSGTGVSRIRPHAGFTAPIGASFNWGNKDDDAPFFFFGAGSFSLFMPVVDVGAVASWRLGSGGGQASSVSWSNVLAPGLFGVWEVRGYPLAIMFGTQYGPELQKVNTKSGNTITKAAWQVPAFGVTFDIPLFNLHRNISDQ